MGVYIDENKLEIITVPKTIYFSLSKYANSSLKHEIDYITKNNDCLVQHTIKDKISQLLSNNVHEYTKQ